MQEDIKKIIEISINAPSGGNSQPWKFEFGNNELYIIGMPEKDHPILNYRNRGTWIAHGALIENIIIASSSLGYKAKVRTFPDQNQPNLTTIISFFPEEQKVDQLFSVIPARTTNRKKYENKLLTAGQKKELLCSISQFDNVEVHFIEDTEKRIIIGRSLAGNEIVTLENEELHKLFFKEISWSAAEELERKSGLYLKTMELKKPQQIILKLLRKWQIMKFFNYFKFAHLIAKDNSKIYSSGVGMAVIVVDDVDEDFLLAGRVMERLWLKATQMGLSCHPITGIMFFWQGLKNNVASFFSKKHKEIINNSYKNIIDECDVKRGVVALILRIGFDGKPSATSFKKMPEIKVIEN